MRARMSQILGAAVMLAASIGAISLATAAPSGISYVGELRADNGVLYSGPVAVSAALFGDATGGEPVWGPQDLGTVAVSQGLFTATIGGAGAPSLDTALMADDSLWLEIWIDGVALEPRQGLRSVPYARVAANAQMVGGTPAGEIATITDLNTKAPVATSQADAPMDPAPGQLWHDTDDGKLYMWTMGAWQPVSAAGLTPEELPFDGLNDVSNGTMSNEFFDVLATWGGDPTIIPDNNLAGINATISLDEGSQARLYGVQFNASIEIAVASQIKIVLQPPVGLGMAPIPLFEETVLPNINGTAQVVDFAWTVDNTPELANLLDMGPAGDWILNVSDTQFTVVPPTEIGTLNSFEILYDVLRSDEILMNGDLQVQGDASVGGDLNLGGSINSNGSLNVSGPVVAKHIAFSGGCTSHGAASGYTTYCLNGVDYNTGEGYFDVNPNGVITIEKAGFYNLNFFAITGNGGSGTWAHVRITLNGQNLHFGHERYYGSHQDNFANFDWRYEAGDQINVDVNGSGGYAFHLWNPLGSGSRHSYLQFKFLGE